MILFKPSLDFETESIFADKNGRYLLLKANVLESSFLFSKIYAPNDSTAQIAFFRNLDNILLPFADAQIILGGDMNCPLTPTDKMGGAPVLKKQKVIDEIEGLIRRFKLHEIWRNQHTNKTQFTWRNNSLKVQCRLDYWLVSKELLMSVIDTNIINPTISANNHTPIRDLPQCSAVLDTFFSLVARKKQHWDLPLWSTNTLWHHRHRASVSWFKPLLHNC